jgi:hypothetical protein
VTLFDQVFATVNQCASGGDAGLVTFAKTGQYRVTVYGKPGGKGTYQFTIYPVAPQIFPLSIGQGVKKDIPAAGAGNIETPGATDIYTFTGTAGATAYFDEQSGAGCDSVLGWKLVDPDGVTVFDQVFAGLNQCGSGGDAGLVTFAKTGQYQVTVYGKADGVGTYQFEIYPVVPQTFPLSIGQVVKKDIPAAGAGIIETPGATDVYTFTGTAGATVYFDEQSGAGCESVLGWKLVDPDGVTVFDQVFAGLNQCGSGGDAGLVTFAKTGQYQVTVYGRADGVGTYQFEIYPVAPQTFPLSIGQVVKKDIPAAGAGIIETPGATDIYTFTGTAGATVYFDEQSGAGCDSVLGWKLVDPDGVTVFDEVFAGLNQCGSGGDAGLVTFAKSGQYRVIVYGRADGVGTYQFEIYPVGPQTFPLLIGQVVKQDVPAPGAGIIETPGATDTYTFTGTAGATVYFDEQSGAGCDSVLWWKLVDPDGVTLFDQIFAGVNQCGSGGDAGLVTFAKTGQYQVTVYGRADGVGPYVFGVYPVSPPVTAPVADRHVFAGETVLVSIVASATIPPAEPLKYLLTSAPPGATLGTNDGVFRWGVPVSASGLYPVSLVVRDALGNEAAVAFQIHVLTLPDLVIASLTAPLTGQAGAAFQLELRDLNRGNAPAQGPWVDRVWLSRDALLGPDDALLAEFPVGGSIAPGQESGRSVQAAWPSGSGTYYLIAQADAGAAVTESDEGDNLKVIGPIQISPTVTAVVQTDLHTAGAGTAVVLHGQASRAGGQPAAGAAVNVFVKVKGTTRILPATSDAAGAFSLVFQPLPGETGSYTVGAAGAGELDAPVQDSFRLVGCAFLPASGSIDVPTNGPGSLDIVLANLGDVPLHQLAIAVTGPNAGLPLTFDLLYPSTLPANGQVHVQVTVSPQQASGAAGQVTLHATTEEGAQADFPLSVRVASRRPHLVVVPGAIEGTMVRSNQKTILLDLRNDGGSATGPVNLLLPAIAWMQVSEALPLPPIPAGGHATVSLRLQPPPTLPLGVYDGSLVATDGEVGATIPYHFTALSDATAALRVEVLDELTYYADGAPKVAGATVSLRVHGAAAELGRKPSNPQGVALFSGLLEGEYDLQVSAPGHSSFQGRILVAAGPDNVVRPFLSRQTVQYEFQVVPATVQDHARIRIETLFETFVPLPVVTIEPAVIDLQDIQSDRTEIDLLITNHGLVAAQEMTLQFASNSKWRFTPLQSRLGDLQARSSVVVPLVIERIGGASAGPLPALAGMQLLAEARAGGAQLASAGGDPGDCDLGGSACWTLICGKDKNTYCAPVVIPGNCFGSGGGYYLPPPVFGAAGPGGIYSPPICSCVPLPCDPCGGKINEELGKFSAGLLAPYFAPVLGPVYNCFVDGSDCFNGVNQCATNAAGCNQQTTFIDCTSAALSCGAIVAVAAGAAEIEAPLAVAAFIWGFAGLGDGLANACKETGGAGQGAPSLASTDPTFFPGQADVAAEGARLRKLGDALGEIFGDPVWQNDRLGTNFSRFISRLQAAAAASSPGGPSITAAERSALLALPSPEGVDAGAVGRFLDRWNRTVDYNSRGILRLSQVPPGESVDFIAVDRVAARWAEAAQAVSQIQAEGYVDDLFGGMRASIQRLKENLSSGGGLCARVRLRLDQDAVMTREAFRASLEIINHSDSPLTGLRTDLVVTEVAGTTATSRFGVLPPELSNLNSIDGTGIVGLSSTGAVSWLIVPGPTAAPTADPVTYFVGGSFSYLQEGHRVTIPLVPAPITVHPDPRLTLTYFHERDVLGDDPFTDAIEPSVPYSLAVMIRNTGNGRAGNVQITSGQPQIIENEKGLLIDFTVIGSEIDGQPVTPSLTADFGTLDPGAIKIGCWLLTSTLQGEFIDYAATLENIGPLKGYPELSTIDSVSIHEMTHVVRAEGPGVPDDGAIDFLVNDQQDDHFLPDTLYRSDGLTEPVGVVQTVNAGGAPTALSPEAVITATAPAGWVYFRFADPADGSLRLVKVTRGDGSEVRFGDNAWTTDRTFIAGGRKPVYEHRVHLFDRVAGAGVVTYHLFYQPAATADTLAPTSGMIRLPAQTRTRIPLQWFGGDNPGGSGIAFYDVYVSVDGGPYAVWLSRTTRTGAVYEGEQGRRYAFYTVATDQAGNVEAAPLVADAETVAGSLNLPPVLTPSPDVAVDEGTTVVLHNLAVDGDVPADALTFSLGAGAPPGARIDPVTGDVTWPTGEGNGPSTNLIAIVVTDSGLPPASVSRTVRVLVREVNQPPVVGPIGGVVLGEGERLDFTVPVQDFDLPPQSMRFAFAGPVPAGLTLDPATGRLEWVPTSLQGPSTNLVHLTVSDGIATVPAVVQIIVRDSEGDFELAIGRSVVAAGSASGVAIRLRSELDLGEVQFRLELLPGVIGQPSLAPSGGGVGGAALQPAGPGVYDLSFVAAAGQSMIGEIELATLSFSTDPAAASGTLILHPERTRGRTSSGAVLLSPRVVNGQVTVVGEQPVFEVSAESGKVVVHGKPGDHLVLEVLRSLDSPTGWTPLVEVVLQGTEKTIDASGLGLESGTWFLRARRL